MAGDWIKMGKDLLTHPKVVRMSSALRADKLRTVGGLFAVWCLFDTHSVDGQLSGYTRETIDEEVRFAGFSDAMEAVGWIEFGEEGASLPDFEEHNGQSAKRRAQETERKRNDRKTSASDADKTRTKSGPEKRREEKSISTSLRSVESAKPRATRQCPESFEVSDELKAWAAAECPGVDLLRETAKFRDHTFKTAHSDWPATWRNWMRNASQFTKTGSKLSTFIKAPSDAEIRLYRSSPHIMDPHVRARVEAHLGVKPAQETIDMEVGHANALALDR